MNWIRVTNTLGGQRIIAGILPWFIPFLIAAPFYKRTVRCWSNAALFKSLMIVIGSVTTAALMVWFFPVLNGSYMREAVITGISWRVLNRAHVVLVVGGLIGMPPVDYLSQIGLEVSHDSRNSNRYRCCG